jgi:hypothetical protein
MNPHQAWKEQCPKSRNPESVVAAEHAAKALLEGPVVVRRLSRLLANAGYAHRFIHGFYEQRETKKILANHTV